MAGIWPALVISITKSATWPAATLAGPVFLIVIEGRATGGAVAATATQAWAVVEHCSAAVMNLECIAQLAGLRRPQSNDDTLRLARLDRFQVALDGAGD